MELIHTVVYDHISNGLIKRGQKSLQRIFRCLCVERQHRGEFWVHYKKGEAPYNNNTHSVTKIVLETL